MSEQSGEDMELPPRMLTAMCPNCRHRFPVSDGRCVNVMTAVTAATTTAANMRTACDCTHNFPVLGGYTTAGHCFINAPLAPTDVALLADCQPLPRESTTKSMSHECHIVTTCDLTGGSVTIQKTPLIQASDCIDCGDGGELRIVQHAPRIEIRPKLNRNESLISISDSSSSKVESLLEESAGLQELSLQPSGCQEFSGFQANVCDHCLRPNISSSPCEMMHNNSQLQKQQQQRQDNNAVAKHCCQARNKPNLSREIKLNATVQLPANVSQCTVNITATTTTSNSTSNSRNSSSSSNGSFQQQRAWGHFNGGGLIHVEDNAGLEEISNTNNERQDEGPPSPISYVMTLPFGLGTYIIGPDFEKIEQTKRLLVMSGWYHEGISWQQSETMLKNKPVGRWLLRDSSDYRYSFALSLQTSRGPTSIRIINSHSGKYRLDAELNLSTDLPSFDCPIKLLLHYINEYSNNRTDDQRREVFVDHTRQLYSQIYLSEPLLREARSLSHQARLIVNRHQLDSTQLPLPINKYLAEYPYGL